MVGAAKSREYEDGEIVLGLLESVERDGAQSQRRLAAQLGIALGLVNAYLKRCAKKGLLKVTDAPAHRYAYYLTPQGFAEKSRLTVEYLSYSFGFFRRAKGDYALLFETARSRGLKRVALAGVSDLAEIAVICAVDSGVEIAAIVDGQSTLTRFVGYPVVGSFDALDGGCEGVMISSLNSTQEAIQAALGRFGADRVLVPPLLEGWILNREGETA